MAVNLASQVVVGRFKVTYKSVELGYTDDVQTIARPRLKEKMVAQTFEQVLGHVVMGVDARVKMTCKEVIKANVALAFPWYGGSGSIALCPTTLGVDLYDYAGALVVHPMEVEDTSQDFNLTKAVVIGGAEIKRDGQEFVTLALEFMGYPDRASLPTTTLGSCY